jgi:hypothetical protein
MDPEHATTNGHSTVVDDEHHQTTTIDPVCK